MTAKELPADVLDQILKYLELPGPSLPSPPLTFLEQNLHILPYSLLQPFTALTTPRERSTIKHIKSRRLLYASPIPPPPLLRADRGRLRWPLLWERLGGSGFPSASSIVDEEASWVKENFMSGTEGSQHVRKLGGFLRELEEEREFEVVRLAKREERRLDDVGEEFDSESDDEDGQGEGKGEKVLPEGNRLVNGVPMIVEGVNQDDVREMFEKRLLELFVDGMDKVDYDEVDFTEPPGGDVLADQDEEDRYFNDEEPSEGSKDTSSRMNRVKDNSGDEERSTQNGEGDYDY